MSTAIKVENLSKAYQLGEIGTGTLSNDLKRWAYKVRGKEDPFLKIGETNDRNTKGESDMVWSLKDINFEIEQGDAVGIIGRNGAGKSTLLKVLSRVTSPTTGSVKVKGRVASLLEVGTGFHPELTGRENIFLNGAILGMRKAEIKKHFDAIVDFAGVERYIDTPVKRYSSGMYVRLAFAVAAHLESEILVVDEVLAVGDAEFQKKCLGKMNDVSKGEGRTVLFVSHNMASVRNLCTSGIVLENGITGFTGSAIDGINHYQSVGKENSNYLYVENLANKIGNTYIQVLSFQIKPMIGAELTISSGVIFEMQFYNSVENINLDTTFELRTADETPVFHHGKMISQKKNSKIGVYTITGVIPEHLLNAGTYHFNLIFGQDQRYSLFNWDHIVQFEIQNENLGSNTVVLPGIIRPNLEYKISYHD